MEADGPNGAGTRNGETGRSDGGELISPPRGGIGLIHQANLKDLDAAGSDSLACEERRDAQAKAVPRRTCPGFPIQDVWTDIPPIHNLAAERLGYPTQKPLSLLKRIVIASSNPGDVILDPFCGCGTTIDAVETLNRENPEAPPRRWIGIDITHLSINLIKHRLTRFVPPPEYEVIGEPEADPAAGGLGATGRLPVPVLGAGPDRRAAHRRR